MELDDLKTAWQMLDRRVEQQSLLNLYMIKQGKLDKLQSSLRPLFWGQIAQIFFGIAMIAFGLSFWTRHRDVTHLLITGLVLHVYGVATIIFAGVTLSRMSGIDYAAPVLGIQKQLARLRRLYVLGGLCIGLPWWVLWMPVLQILFMNSFGADLYVNLGVWTWLNYAIGGAGLLASLGLHRWSLSPKRPRLAAAVNASLTGSSLQKARRFLDEIEQFERA